ncbi:MAG TPA: alpha/beta hydrolase [Candidatus Methylomirabilis sp.]|nr:alpha/beta hydrolase [Candidatus Methylomirabilis sp.]
MLRRTARISGTRFGWIAGRAAALAAFSLVGLLVGCGQPVSRVEEAAPRPADPNRVPIILIPGISRETARVLKGGSVTPFSALALRTDEDALAHLGDPGFPVDGTAPAAIPAQLDRALRGTNVRGFQPLIDRLVREEGYIRGSPDNPHDKDYSENPQAEREDRTRVASLFVLYYDWRRDLAESACMVAERIARIRATTGAQRVLLVGNSLGGVVARYYLRYGGRDAMRARDCPGADAALATAVNAPGGKSVSRAVLLAAPHRGSANAFRALMQDFRLFGFVGVGLRQAVFTMPLAWELLPWPDPDGRVALLIGEDGDERVSLYDVQTWVARGWLLGDGADPETVRFADSMLARAVAFHESMLGRNPAEESVPRLAVGGECRPTITRAFAAQGRLEFLSRDRADHALFSRATAPGDGVVTAESALGLPPSPTLTTLRVCSGHSTYLEDPDTLDHIVRFLLE